MGKGDREILKADIEDGYTPIANLILEALAMAKISGVQKGICMFLFRRTYGWGIKEDVISLKEFAEALDTSSSYVSKQLKQLIEWNIIIRTSYEPGKAPTYTFNTRVEQWNKGCINVQGLNECTKQGLYKCTKQGLHICARVDSTQSIDTTESEACLNKDINKDINKYNNIYCEQAHSEDDKNKKYDTKKQKNKQNNKESKYTDEDKAIAHYLKDKLTNNGVNVFARDWLLKNYSTAHRLLNAASSDDIKNCIDWLFDDSYWHDKVDSLLVVERQLARYQLQRQREGPSDVSAGNAYDNLF